MPIRVANVRLELSQPEEVLPALVQTKLGIPASQFSRCRILRKSLDARSRYDLHFVCTLLVELHDESTITPSLQQRWPKDIGFYDPPKFEDANGGTLPLKERPVVVGSGPAGLLAAYYLAIKGFRPIVLERGLAVKERVPAVRLFDRGGEFDRENNYLFGEGGAGCFSDGKLTCRMTGPDVDWVLERFVECGGRPSILYEHRPHLGSNRLPMICRNFRRKIEAHGGEYRFGCNLEDLDISEGRVVGVQTSSGYLRTRTLFLGIGHSARDTAEMLLARGVPIVQKAFQLGLRIEQPQSQINDHKYGTVEQLSLLGPADYTLQARGTRDIYSFCMCAGGYIMPSVSEPEKFCSNGMSNSRHDSPFANSGVMVTLEPHEFGGPHPLAGMYLQRQFEEVAFRAAGSNYLCPIQPAKDFLGGKPVDRSAHYDCSYERGTIPVALEQVLPHVVVAALRSGMPAMDSKFRGAFLKHAMLVGPEMRGSSPIRMERSQVSRESPGIAGLYPIGEGAGYAGGIVTAAVDGLRSARSLVAQYQALQ